MGLELVSGVLSSARMEAAASWLLARKQTGVSATYVIAPSHIAARSFLRSLASRQGSLFGITPLSYRAFLQSLAAPALARRDVQRASPLMLEAIALDSYRSLEEEHLALFEPLRESAHSPGFSRALYKTLSEVRLATNPPEVPWLRKVLARYEERLEHHRVADLRRTLEAAKSEAVAEGATYLFLDCALGSDLERELIDTLASGGRVMATNLGGTSLGWTSLAGTSSAGTSSAGTSSAGTSSAGTSSAANLPELATLHAPVTFVEAREPGLEARAALRIALRAAESGLRFDQIAIACGDPERYRPSIQSNAKRAGVPVHFSHGAKAPDPRGRAFLSLLRFRTEGYPASRFVEYLAFGVAPATGVSSSEVPWQPEELDTPGLELEMKREGQELPDTSALRVSQRWERWIVDAAVIGGKARWETRLQQLLDQLASAIEDTHVDDPEYEALTERRAETERLQEVAFRMLDALESLPERAGYAAFSQALKNLAAEAIVDSERIVNLLDDVASLPGETSLAALTALLERYLSEVVVRNAEPPGTVLFARPEELLGRAYEEVIVLGVADGRFPRLDRVDPLLSDEAREACGMHTRADRDRLQKERFASAIGAGKKHVWITWPRYLDAQRRPGAPSAFALACWQDQARRLGNQANYEELIRSAREEYARLSGVSLDFEDIVLKRFLERSKKKTAGGVAGELRFALTHNPSLRASLLQAFRRSQPKLSSADGLVPSRGRAKRPDWLAAHQLSERSFSATALQRLASCPLQFAYDALARIRPREIPSALETLDARQRGTLIHDAQFSILSRLRDEGLLAERAQPQVRAATRNIVREELAKTAAQHHEELAPALPETWERGIADIEQDLLRWADLLADDVDFEPAHFELAFGVPGRGPQDPSSREEPVGILGGRLKLRGSIDLVERGEVRGKPALRVTDHKTGRKLVGLKSDFGVKGGKVLQPSLYALAARAILEENVVAARLYYSTSRGGFSSVEASLDRGTERALELLMKSLEGALHAGLFPAAPSEEKDCSFCDQRSLCHRGARKRAAELPLKKDLPDLFDLRSQP